MGTVIRANLSKNNKYYIDKHRYYELKHFCLQYKEWKKEYFSFDSSGLVSSQVVGPPAAWVVSDPTSRHAIRKARLAKRIKMIEEIAYEADPHLYEYILKAVTEGLSYTHLKARLEIPCGRDMYYDRYRRFFWLLSENRC